MDERTWTVVNFTEEQSVAAVPSSWIIGRECYWPNLTQSKIAAAITSHATPDPAWSRHPITIFRNSTYDDYRAAELKAKPRHPTPHQLSAMITKTSNKVAGSQGQQNKQHETITTQSATNMTPTSSQAARSQALQLQCSCLKCPQHQNNQIFAVGHEKVMQDVEYLKTLVWQLSKDLAKLTKALEGVDLAQNRVPAVIPAQPNRPADKIEE